MYILECVYVYIKVCIYQSMFILEHTQSMCILEHTLHVLRYHYDRRGGENRGGKKKGIISQHSLLVDALFAKESAARTASSEVRVCFISMNWELQPFH
jgi:hypothetical protein